MVTQRIGLHDFLAMTDRLGLTVNTYFICTHSVRGRRVDEISLIVQSAFEFFLLKSIFMMKLCLRYLPKIVI